MSVPHNTTMTIHLQRTESTCGCACFHSEGHNAPSAIQSDSQIFYLQFWMHHGAADLKVYQVQLLASHD